MSQQILYQEKEKNKMAITNTKTNTYAYAFTQIQVVIDQYAIALDYVGTLSNKKKDLLLEAIENKQISEVGIYAYNKDHKRVNEFRLMTDWDKHQQIITTFGEMFDEGKDGFLYATGEAVETTRIYQFVEWARDMGLSLSIWVRTSKTITGQERENLLNRIGFNGGPPDPWAGDIIIDTSTEYQAIPQMTLGYRSTV